MNSKTGVLQITLVVFIFNLRTIHDQSTVSFCPLLSMVISTLRDAMRLLLLWSCGCMGERLRGVTSAFQKTKQFFFIFTRRAFKKKKSALSKKCGVDLCPFSESDYVYTQKA